MWISEEETITEEKKEIIMKKTTLIAAVATLFVLASTVATAYYSDEEYGDDYQGNLSSLSTGPLDVFADGSQIHLSTDMENLDQVDMSAIISAATTSDRLNWGFAFILTDNESYDLNFCTGALTFTGNGSLERDEDRMVAMSGNGTWLKPIPAGEIFNGLAFAGEGSGLVTVYDDAETNLGSFEVVPEPSMIALMGVGGLILARRNRKA
jgi:hypothetical protein